MTNATPRNSSPLRLTGELDPNLSRWLWLVKMFLAIPHFVILAILWVPFIITSLVAGAAILVTGRYPRALFNFNESVLRWNWRVGFYVYAALGTDQYPPFTFGSTDYPADLELDYPERMSKPLVLAKWLLAVPHLVVVALILTDLLAYPWAAGTTGNAGQPSSAYSILNLLVVIAGVFLLITGRYPRGLFDLLMGMNRWIYRVLVYVSFMRDEYPPFRLDAGGSTRLLDSERDTSAVPNG